MESDASLGIYRFDFVLLTDFQSSVRKTFTLDFGDYEDDYLNVTCDEAEALSSYLSLL